MTARIAWRVGRLATARPETASARTLSLAVTGWPGHEPGQHVDLRLTAEDGYSTQRSYSIAAPPDGDRVVLTVQLVADGEVSPFLVDDFAVGDEIELRGPIGGWFVWRPVWPEPVLLVGGGSGIVPLMAMARARVATGGPSRFRLVHSVRTPADRFYADEVAAAVEHGDLAATIAHTRVAPDAGEPPRRVRAADFDVAGWRPVDMPRCYVCGPTGFVEAVATMLVGLGHDPRRIRTERFGPTGGS